MEDKEISRSKFISFVIPVFRNQGTITLTHNKISQLFNEKLSGFGYEVIFVDDGSDDDSLSELLALQANNSNIKIISFSRNFGQVAAIIAGLKETIGSGIIVMSADTQDPLEIVTNMIQEWQQGNEIVICTRTDRDDGFFSKITSRFFYNLIKISVPKMPSGGFDYLLLDRKTVEILNTLDERNRFFQGDILWLGFSIKFIPYKRHKRTIGKSQWTFNKKFKYFIDGFLNTSYLPIRFISFFGLSTAIIGFIYALIIVYYRFTQRTPFTGWSPIMVLILLIGGLIMIMLGVIGEYIWRIYDETRKRPLYVIKNKY